MILFEVEQESSPKMPRLLISGHRSCLTLYMLQYRKNYEDTMRCGLYISCKIDAVGSFTAEVNCP